MTIMEPAPLPQALTLLKRLPRFLRAALRHATGSLIAVAALLGSARVATISLSAWIGGDGEPLKTLYRLVPSEVTAGCMLIAVLLAEQCVRNGARRLNSYLLAVIVAAAVSALLATPLIFLMHDHGIPMIRQYRKSGPLGTALYYFADALARGGLAAFVFANREKLLRSVGQLRAAGLERARTERDLAHSNLMAVQATMEPEALLSTLETVRTLYEENSSEADNRLGVFIEHLRSVTVAIRA